MNKKQNMYKENINNNDNNKSNVYFQEEQLLERTKANISKVMD